MVGSGLSLTLVIRSVFLSLSLVNLVFRVLREEGSGAQRAFYASEGGP